MNLGGHQFPTDTMLSAAPSYSSFAVHFFRQDNPMPTLQEAVTSTISWFEIPATDFPRAIRFYETIFGKSLIHDAAWPKLAIFPYEKPGISGAIAQGEGREPAGNGIIIYLNCDGKFDAVLNRVEGAGGSIVEPKTQIPNIGWIAQILDSEGNRIGLHAAA